MSNEINVYLASGWFSPNQLSVINDVEEYLRSNPNIKPYFPRHDGIKLTPNELHDSSLRKRVFDDNVVHIKQADLVLACCDGRDGFYDTGTQWEIGYAMSLGIPVIAYDTTMSIYTSMKSILGGFFGIAHTIGAIDVLLENSSPSSVRVNHSYSGEKKKVLFIGPDSTESHKETNEDIISSVVLECNDSNFRWLDDLNSPNVYKSMRDIFSDISYMVSVIDDRHPIVSWMMGQAYGRDIPIVTYTNFDYGVNLMLMCSLVHHCKGKDELRKIMQKIKREGIESLPRFDDSQVKVY